MIEGKFNMFGIMVTLSAMQPLYLNVFGNTPFNLSNEDVRCGYNTHNFIPTYLDLYLGCASCKKLAFDLSDLFILVVCWFHQFLGEIS